jgi:hypothetical protein
MKMSGSRIHLAFRYHLNFYHSYRGDSLDERGIGKDIRIIGGLLADLDALNAAGIPVRGTWDIENYFSLETMMRRHCPDLIERIAARVDEGRDEIELMSYNNGIVAACTPEEFREQSRLCISNDGGSGFDDLFSSWRAIVRPQECMYTPSFLREYPDVGVPCISIYNSAVPFNGFSTFVEPLDLVRRYNPLTLRADGMDEGMTLLPAYNHGDIADHWLSLRRWIKSMRREQMKLDNPQDLLLLIDMDADDQFWAGEDIPVLTRLVPSFDGFRRLMESIADLDYLVFTTPGDYLDTHAPVGEVTVNQDCADGSFDGYSSWAEKWENTELWTLIHKSREAEQAARWFLRPEAAAAGTAAPDREVLRAERELAAGLRSRLLAMSTTHFGMASPVMNASRLEDGMTHGRAALQHCLAALELLQGAKPAVPAEEGATFLSLVPDARVIRYAVSAPERASGSLLVRREDGGFLSVRPKDGGADRLLVSSPTADHDRLAEPSEHAAVNLHIGARALQIGFHLSESAGAELRFPSVTYAGKRRSAQAEASETRIVTYPGGLEMERTRIDGSIDLGGAAGSGRWSWTVHVSVRGDGPDLQDGAIYLDVEYQLPETADRGYDRGKASRLDRTWDHRWQEFMPAEIVPAFTAPAASPYRIIKHNFFGDMSSFELDYGRFSSNHQLDSFNNQITNGWVAVSGAGEGLLVAQQTRDSANFAFCPMRLRERNGTQQIYMNPFGTYYGRQWRYPTAVTGIGRRMAIAMADQLDSYAPSFNGKSQRFSLMIVPFTGRTPECSLRDRAMVYSSGLLQLN